MKRRGEVLPQKAPQGRRRLLQRGQGTVEYILVFGVIVLIIIAAGLMFRSSVAKSVSRTTSIITGGSGDAEGTAGEGGGEGSAGGEGAGEGSAGSGESDGASADAGGSGGQAGGSGGGAQSGSGGGSSSVAGGGGSGGSGGDSGGSGGAGSGSGGSGSSVASAAGSEGGEKASGGEQVSGGGSEKGSDSKASADSESEQGEKGGRVVAADKGSSEGHEGAPRQRIGGRFDGNMKKWVIIGVIIALLFVVGYFYTAISRGAGARGAITSFQTAHASRSCRRGTKTCNDALYE